MNPLGLPDEFHPLFGSPIGTPLTNRAAARCASTSSVAVHPVPARRAGGDGVRGQDRRGRPRPGREVLRRHPDHGRGPPRRDVLAVPPGEDRPGLPDQQESDGPAGRHPARLALGHALSRHAGAHRRARARRLRGAARHGTARPLAKQILAYVMQDEARHVAFGRIALRDYYPRSPKPSAASARSSSSRPAT